MKRAIYLSIAALSLFVVYTICSYDLRFTDIQQYNKKIVIYTREECIFCSKAEELLNRKNMPYVKVDITWDKELYAKLLADTGQVTVPYVFVDDKFIGGCEELQNLVKSTKLNELQQ